MEEEELRGWRGGKRRKEMRGEKRRGRGMEKEGEEERRHREREDDHGVSW